MSSPAELLLSRLDRVRRTSPGRWTAICPAHEDKSPSLSVRELDDGRLLLHCFGGCEVDEVVGAVGLRVNDLFPARLPTPGGGTPPVRLPFSAADLIELAAHEAGVLLIVASDLLSARDVSEADFERVVQSARRLSDVWEATHAR